MSLTGPLPQDVYATNLQLNRGYPLRIPEPNKKLGEPYAKEGFQIGDIGHVNNYGEFIPLFNIAFPLPNELRRRGIPQYDPIQFNRQDKNNHESISDQIFMGGVEWQANEPSMTYKFTATSNTGAILIVPSGAALCEIQEPEVLEAFQAVAMKYASLWCEHTRHESLYLITGVYKTRSWTLGAFHKGRPGGDVFVQRQDGGMYKWKYTFEVDFRPGPGNNNYENQTIIMKGFKMTLRRPPGFQPLAVIEQVTGVQGILPSWITLLLALLTSMFGIFPRWLPRVTTVEHDPRLSQPFHPLDLINHYLLDENPEAKVAITHDNQWIDMLEKRLVHSDLMHGELLRKFLEEEYVSKFDHDTVYLGRFGQVEDTDRDGARCKSKSLQLMPAMGDVQIAITHIRAENITVGLGRIPVGFYIQVDFCGTTPKRTKNRPSEVHDYIIQWDDRIELPSDTSAMVRLMVCASFQFSPMLGKGEPLRIMEMSVGELLGQTNLITFPRREGETMFPCSSLLISVQQWNCDRQALSPGQVNANLDCEESSELAKVTDLGHGDLLRYHRSHSEVDLKSSVAHFEHALDICPDGNEYRPAVLFNLATVKLVAYQFHGELPDLNISASLYRESLKLRCDDHPDRPATLIHLSRALLHHYGAVGYDASEGELKMAVDKLVDISPEGTHEYLAASLVHQTYECLALGDLTDPVHLDKLISTLDMAAHEPPEGYFDKPFRFYNLSLALLRRFQLGRDAGDFNQAFKWLEKSTESIPGSICDCDLGTILPTFGWSLGSPEIMLQRYRCEELCSTGHVEEAAEALFKILDDFGAEISASKLTESWVIDLKKRCVDMLEILGDAAVTSGEHSDAITRYTFALTLEPTNPDILVKRSKSWASKGHWWDALTDANKAINADPTSPWGYERRHAALHALEKFGEAVDAFTRMLLLMEQSLDQDIRLLAKNYIPPSKSEVSIEKIVREMIKICPIVLIDVESGRLCHATERIRTFKSSSEFKGLISSMTEALDDAHIVRVVATYFRYVTLSHVWQGKEPSFQDVNAVTSVWNLDSSPLNEKLKNFCKVVQTDGYRWAWSDTCCIDKTTSTVLNQSLVMMYNWYEASAAMLVLLATADSPSVLGALADDLWVTRAWTAQEVLAAKVVRFYDRNWKPYLGDTRTNHKDSPEIMQELAAAIGIPENTIAAFNPDDLSVREKLRVASTRNATVEEDVAYSLIGIFKSDIRPHYGEGDAALGHLLEEIVARSGEVTVLDWVGRSSSYNSCLPATLAVYSQPPRTTIAIGDTEMDSRVEELRSSIAPSDANLIHDRFTRLPPARFANRRLRLPCVIFAVKRLGVKDIDGTHGSHFRAQVSGIGSVEFQTSDRLPLTEPRRLILVHPWIRDLCDPFGEFGWGSTKDDDESESDQETEAGSSPSAPMPAISAATTDVHTRALQLIARLQQPFYALLLQQQPNGEFRRVAAEHEILVPGIEREINFTRDVRTDVVEIL